MVVECKRNGFEMKFERIWHFVFKLKFLRCFTALDIGFNVVVKEVLTSNHDFDLNI
jgi:hypothetical protein